MTTRLSQSRSGKRGFTLVELLVVITVIGILVGMLAAAIIPALQRGKEAAIQFEMKQIETSIEEFRAQNGFYPPNCENITQAQFQRFVDLLAPNNRENLGGWWTDVGQHLDRESSLVFWLSGTFKNKQFPITGDGATTAVPAHNFGNDNLGDRDVYFDFVSGQLFGDDSDESTPGAAGLVFKYMQAHGKSSGDLLYKYTDAASYRTAGSLAYNFGGNYINSESFQLISYGLDGERGPVSTAAASRGIIANNSDISPDGEDNLCSFANGRVRLWLNANSGN